MNTEKSDIITIICANEDCDCSYRLSMDTLHTVKKVEIHCQDCGTIQRIYLNDNGGIEIYHVR